MLKFLHINQTVQLISVQFVVNLYLCICNRQDLLMKLQQNFIFVVIEIVQCLKRLLNNIKQKHNVNNKNDYYIINFFFNFFF